MLRLRMARPSQPDGSLAPNTFDVGARLADALAELREIEQLVKASPASTLAARGIRAAIHALQRRRLGPLDEPGNACTTRR